MDVLVGRESLLDIVDCGHRHTVEEAVVGKIEAIDVPILRCHSHEPLPAIGDRRSDEGRDRARRADRLERSRLHRQCGRPAQSDCAS